MPERYIGLMSGTSMDAIDAVLVEFAPLRLIATHSEPIPFKLKENLLALAASAKDAIKLLGETDNAIGHLFATAAEKVLKKANVPSASICAIGSHGQTVYHAPSGKYPFTLQIGDPNIIATITGITTIADFRRRDIALGGQAAPLTPAFHNFLLRDKNEDRFVLNIGGIANLTFLFSDFKKLIIGFDTGPGNTLTDSWCMRHLKKSYDHDGKWAASGKVQTRLLNELLADPYFHRSPPKSTGREYFNLDWLAKKLKGKNFNAEDIQTTLVELTARSVIQAFQYFPMNPGSLWLCGGGAHNHYLIERLTMLYQPLRITTTEEIGIHPDWIEAVCFAWLAKQTVEGKPGNLPSVTGAKKPAVLGAIYNGSL